MTHAGHPATDHVIASFDGVPLHATVQGEGGVPLVFIHGWACDQTFWAPQVAAFSPVRTVVTLDLAGHGASGANRVDWSMSTFGRDVQAVVEALALEDPVLVGHSMGGAVMLEAERLMPERVAGLVGVDTFTYDGFYPRQPDHVVATVMAPFRADFVSATRDLARGLFPRGTDPALVERVAATMSSLPASVGLASLEKLLRWDLAAALERSRVPLLTINSALFLPGDAQERYRSSFEIVPLPGVGHFLMLEDPELFNRALAQRLAGLAEPRASRPIAPA